MARFSSARSMCCLSHTFKGNAPNPEMPSLSVANAFDTRKYYNRGRICLLNWHFENAYSTLIFSNSCSGLFMCVYVSMYFFNLVRSAGGHPVDYK